MGPLRLPLVAAFATACLHLHASSAEAAEEPVIAYASPPPAPPPDLVRVGHSEAAFDQPLALGAYTVGWAGAYDAAGAGGRARWELWQHRLGVETFAEALFVSWPGGGSRHDFPIGFNVYAPLALGSRARLRAMAGFCAVFSFIEPGSSGGPPSNDVIFGAHGGVGLEVALAGPVVWFVDAQAVWYLGHDRTASDWSGAVSGSLSQAVVFQPSTGLEVAFGR